MKTITYNPETHRLVPVEREYMFNVEVENTANAVFDTAEEAVDYAMHYVYMDPALFQEAVDTLNSGQVFHFSYGFTAANLVPVAKRSAAPVFDTVEDNSQPEPVEVEPVAYYTDQGGWPRICLAVDGNHDGYETPLYTAPPDYAALKQQLEEIKRQRDELAKALEWQPIETAPKDGQAFDVWVMSTKNKSYGVRMTNVYYNNGVICGMRYPDASFGEYASHWMPLPAAPAALTSVKGGVR